MTADYRSDTVTRPGPGMLEAMMSAPVGDDVFVEDPSINELEFRIAELFGREAAIFCPSGTMTNQIGIKCHTQPGDEVICDKQSHVYLYEGGGIAFNAGCSVRPLEGERGMITAAQIREHINPDDVHRPVTRLVSLENTANRGGGSCYDFKEILRIKELCQEHRLKLHLDGARIFNALVARGESPAQYGQVFDSISICLSKGLGCPVGSLLVGDRDFIARGRRLRKVLGGGMRQAGYLAAAGLYAIYNNINRLAEDHAHAHQIAQCLIMRDYVGHVLPVETNIIIFEVLKPFTAATLVTKLAEYGIQCFAISPTQVRMVVHLDISADMIRHTLDVLESI